MGTWVFVFSLLKFTMSSLVCWFGLLLQKQVTVSTTQLGALALPCSRLIIVPDETVTVVLSADLMMELNQYLGLHS